MSGDAEQVVLPDGRRLDVLVSGPPGGLPLVIHHGTPGARTAVRHLATAAHARGLRLITTSRPGYGSSDRHRGRRVVDVVADTEVVLRRLDVSRCLVAGWSGGGPHALACAARLDEAAATLVIAGVAPCDAAGLEWMDGMGEDNVVEFTAAMAGEDRLRAFLVEQGEQLKGVTVDAMLASLDSLLPEIDRRALTDEFGEDMAASFREALRQSIDGWLDDDLAFTTGWGFDLAEVHRPVAFWQGSEDLMVPFAHGQWFAGQLAQASTHLEDGEGHLSIVLGSLDRALDELIGLAGGV